LTAQPHRQVGFRRAIERCALWMAEDAARELPNLPLEDALRLVHLDGLPRWKPASRSRRSWRRAPSNPDSGAVGAFRSRGDRVVPVDSVCPGDSVNYPGAWGFPLPLPQTARCALDANQPPGPSLMSKVQLVPSSEYRHTPAAAKITAMGSCGGQRASRVETARGSASVGVLPSRAAISRRVPSRGHG
jgi:hypothetical protein